MPILHSEDESSEDNENYSSESEDSDEEIGKMMKPVFVRKENRMTIKEQENRVLLEESIVEKKKVQKEERKNQTRVMVAESIKRADELNDNHLDDANSDAGLPDDTDDLDDEFEVSLNNDSLPTNVHTF